MYLNLFIVKPQLLSQPLLMEQQEKKQKKKSLPKPRKLNIKVKKKKELRYTMSTSFLSTYCKVSIFLFVSFFTNEPLHQVQGFLQPYSTGSAPGLSSSSSFSSFSSSRENREEMIKLYLFKFPWSKKEETKDNKKEDKEIVGGVMDHLSAEIEEKSRKQVNDSLEKLQRQDKSDNDDNKGYAIIAEAETGTNTNEEGEEGKVVKVKKEIRSEVEPNSKKPSKGFKKLEQTEKQEKVLWYKNPDFDEKEIDSLWISHKKSLIRIGAKGVLKSHRNSLEELATSHHQIKVKVNNREEDIRPTVEELLYAEAAEGEDESEKREKKQLYVLLKIKGREAMIAPMEDPLKKKEVKPKWEKKEEN